MRESLGRENGMDEMEGRKKLGQVGYLGKRFNILRLYAYYQRRSRQCCRSPNYGASVCGAGEYCGLFRGKVSHLKHRQTNVL